MPRNGSGTYTLPEAAFVGGTAIDPDIVNSDLSDIALALTASIAADGQTTITGAFKLINGGPTAPAYSFISDTTTGMYSVPSLPSYNSIRFAIQGIGTFAIQTPQSNGSFIAGPLGCIISPVGAVSDFCSATIPTGWFLCYGQAVSRTSYSALFTIIGTTYGSGDGINTFNLPDFRGYVLAGKDNMGGSSAGRLSNMSSTTLGATGGEQSHTLDVSEMPNHGHTVNDPGHSHSINTPTNASASGQSGTGAAISFWTGSAATSTGSATTGITLGTAGGGGGHNNIQPTAIVNKIIFAGTG